MMLPPSKSEVKTATFICISMLTFLVGSLVLSAKGIGTWELYKEMASLMTICLPSRYRKYNLHQIVQFMSINTQTFLVGLLVHSVWEIVTCGHYKTTVSEMTMLP